MITQERIKAATTAKTASATVNSPDPLQSTMNALNPTRRRELLQSIDGNARKRQRTNGMQPKQPKRASPLPRSRPSHLRRCPQPSSKRVQFEIGLDSTSTARIVAVDNDENRARRRDDFNSEGESDDEEESDEEEEEVVNEPEIHSSDYVPSSSNTNSRNSPPQRGRQRQQTINHSPARRLDLQDRFDLPAQHQRGSPRRPGDPNLPARGRDPLPNGAQYNPVSAQEVSPDLKGYKANYSADPHSCGNMTKPCHACGALRWVAEETTKHEYLLCCKNGDVTVPEQPPVPQILQELYTADTEEAKHFQEHIRKYNNSLSFTSVSYTKDQRLQGQRNIQTFQMQGEIYHIAGPLRHEPGAIPNFAQFYFLDPDEAVLQRSRRYPQLKQAVLNSLTRMVAESGNPYPAMYMNAAEKLRAFEGTNNPFQIRLNPQMQLVVEKGTDLRRYNLPTHNEVAVLIPDEPQDNSRRDYVVACRREDGSTPEFVRISPSHPAYMPLHYILLFPHGTPGWTVGLELQNLRGTRKRTTLTPQMYYRHHLYVRSGVFSTILHARRLFQQFVCDAVANIERFRLNWVRDHQKQLRAELYKGIQDALASDATDLNEMGQRIVLPASFTGSDRQMQQYFQDSMALVRHFGKPTLFLTFTANPKWREILDALGPRQNSMDRPDIVARVFRMKVVSFLKDIKTAFGKYQGMVWTIEYQKRGLPHLHCLLFLKTEHNIADPCWIDQIVSAELPDPAMDLDGSLTEIIKTCMVHGPCGPDVPDAPCMVERKSGEGKKCKRGFPKQFQPVTVVEEDGYPKYQRREGVEWEQVKGTRRYKMDHRWIVPYNPWLSRRYDAHINVEICATVNAIKYIHKYVYKGEDRATLQLTDANRMDEIAKYVSGRYIGPTQACWRLFEFSNHEEDPGVERLVVHLENEQTVTYSDDADAEAMQERLEKSKSTLMAFFEYNQSHEDGRQYLYQQFPEHYVFNKTNRCWTIRKKDFRIGRIYHCNPIAGERFYLRLLLTVVRGPRNFEELRTYEGRVYPTFQEACKARGLLEDDQEWISCFNEAVTHMSGSCLRTLFLAALLHGELTRALDLWMMFRSHICDDLPHRLRAFTTIPADFLDPHFDYGLFLLAEELHLQGKAITEFGLPVPQLPWSRLMNPLLMEQLNYDTDGQQQLRDTNVERLNADQKHAFDIICTAIDWDPTSSKFFVQGPGGTGKTFLYQTLCHHYRAQGKVVLCCASSGVAALLLPGGRTSHSTFKIPLDSTAESTCAIKKGTQLCELIRATHLIIWDEVPMQNKNDFAAVDRTLRDLMDVDESVLFGGIPVVMGGDFAQTLPVVKKGNRTQQCNASILRSALWPRFTVLHLRINMRLLTTPENRAYAMWIKNMSYNERQIGRIELPAPIKHRYTDLPVFIGSVFPVAELANAHRDWEYFKSRAILTVQNLTVVNLNNQILNGMSGREEHFRGITTADVNDGVGDHSLPDEFLQTLNPPELPAATLRLKVGAPIMLMRNLHPKEGLCNGTRMVITHLHRHCITAKILGGDHDGQTRMIPRIKLSTKPGPDMPWIITRKQFPIRLCFAITVNKSQGQSLSTVGVDLRMDCFSHGQLYVALSRVTDVNRLSILFDPNREQKTDNVVYPEVLLRQPQV